MPYSAGVQWQQPQAWEKLHGNGGYEGEGEEDEGAGGWRETGQTLGRALKCCLLGLDCDQRSWLPRTGFV
jgi:hypothetical protein